MRSDARRLFLVALAATAAFAGGAQAAPARYVILMVADGAGFNTWDATSMYRGSLGHEFRDAPEWTRLAASTHALREGAAIGVSATHANTQFPSLTYDPTKAWDVTPVPGAGEADRFAGYRWLRQSAPDSAATATALASGHKSYDAAINVDGAGKPIEETLARLAHDAGKRVGIVTSVPFSHATPAAMGGAHATKRDRYCEIAVDLLTSGLVDVLMGTGHPEFDNNGHPIEDVSRREYRYVGGREVWEHLAGVSRLAPGDRVCVPDDPAAAGQAGITLGAREIAALDRWVLRQRREAIESAPPADKEAKLLLVPQVGQIGFWPGWSARPDRPHHVFVGGTLQQGRGSQADPRYTPPGWDPPTPGLPTLAGMTQAALAALGDRAEGFFLHVEGGAVDWAMHDNQMGRMIEEMQDFQAAIDKVVQWVDARDAWDETLVVITADHDHLLWGPKAVDVPFDPLQDRGAGQVPGYHWLGTSHANALVPVYARGVGVERLLQAADGRDPFRGPYLDQTEIFAAARALLTGAD